MNEVSEKLGVVKTNLISPDPDEQDQKFETLLKELRRFTVTEQTEHILNTLAGEKIQDANNSNKNYVTKEE